jgi:hypothetical protein
MPLKELTAVVFVFEDGATLTLDGDNLTNWVAICYMHSDYLLPGNERMVLASGYGDLIQGFVPPEICKEQ